MPPSPRLDAIAAFSMLRQLAAIDIYGARAAATMLLLCAMRQRLTPLRAATR